ncbi:flagellar hook-length control protein FliK [Geobacter sp.]|uniref:flagellar hook-length control protein FliK n=1 Tax=Geobacter sp. TaxID=46610 RepID=UPI00262625F8|nr:flagellar hook-length control protein FliK [Geobacter sp.]
MIVTQEIARIAQALLKDSAASLVEATWQSLTPLNLTPGQVVQGEVLASLPQSRYLVRVANELLKMELPLNLQPGQAVELTYVTDEPRVVFALSKSANSGVPVQLSDTGRWLNTLTREGTPSTTTSPLPRPALILQSPPENPATLAEGLKNALTRSGTFYESHLAGWVRGNLPLTELLREPQGSLSPLAAHLPADPPETISPPPSSKPPQGVATPPPTGEPAPPEQNPPRQVETTRGTASPAAPGVRGESAPAGESETLPERGAAPSAPPDRPTAAPARGEAPLRQGEGTARPAETTLPPGSGSPPPSSAPLPEGGSPKPVTTGSPAPTPHEPAPPPGAPGASPAPHPAPETVLSRDLHPQPEREPFPPNREAAPHPSPERSATGREPLTPPETPRSAPSPERAGTPRPTAAPAAPVPGDTAMASRIGDGAASDRTTALRAPSPPPPGGVEPQTIPIIKEQLAVLTTGVFSWLGQVWPGQDMEWTVQEREAEGGAGGRNWQTEVRIAFPRLGEVRATLTLAGEGVAVTLVAAEEQTATLLAGGAKRLRENMEGAGITLSGLAVRHGGS